MKGIANWFSRWHGLPIATAVLVLAAMGVLLARGADQGGANVGGIGYLVVGFIALVLLVFVANLVVLLSGVDPDAASIAHRLTTGPEQQRLLERWLGRTRWARNVGGLSGIGWWLFGTSAQGDPLLCGVAGIAVGSVVAQLHHVRSPSGSRTASLDRRSVREYIPIEWERRMLVMSVLSVALVIAGFSSANGGGAVRWGAVSIVALASVHLVQRRVAARPRPALSGELHVADDLARGLAIDRGLAQPATYLSLALFAHGVGSLAATHGGAATAISVAAWLFALRLWWLNRRLGLDDVVPLTRAVPATV